MSTKCDGLCPLNFRSQEKNTNVEDEEVTMQLRRSRSYPNVSDAENTSKIVIGICAMDKKAHSEPMSQIVEGLLQNKDFRVVIFGDQMILEENIEDWPECDCLMCWYSEGFPLLKAEEYVKLRKPFLINDVGKQKSLRDRRKVYSRLREAGIPIPVHIVINRDKLEQGQDPEGFIETEDFVEINGKRIIKPFVEKPVSGENHNIYIYYPNQMGGGVKYLFRKKQNKSGSYDPHHPGNVRRNGSFIYEEFLATGGTDVKVYTVGPCYAHAEARKSPVVDGIVERTKHGKEVRCPVLLTPEEKEIARQITFAFGQQVCGFDLLRTDNGSFVCDVNGWSFVKSSYKYYEDASKILRHMILSRLAPNRLNITPLIFPSLKAKDELLSREHSSFDDLEKAENAPDIKECEEREGEELRCVLAVVRHGDRTPKQKMKIKTKHQAYINLYESYKDSKGKQAKLKDPQQLQELLDVTRDLIQELSKGKEEKCNGSTEDSEDLTAECKELRGRLRIVVSVLEAGGHFSGINRKVQLKPLQWSVQSENSDEPPKVEELLLILKHGGVLTHAGRKQAEKFGNHFRTSMYPGSEKHATTSGLLRLHSTYRHDFKIYSSDEGRVQTSAAAFTKGLLDLEGSSLTPILASLVKKDTKMLDAFDKGASADIQISKNYLYQKMTKSKENQGPSLILPLIPSPTPSDKVSLDSSGHIPPDSPIKSQCTISKSDTSNNYINASAFSINSDFSDLDEKLQFKMEETLPLLYKLVDLMKVLVEELYNICMDDGSKNSTKNTSSVIYSSLSQDTKDWKVPQPNASCSGEKLLLLYDRWRKLLESFYNEKKDTFNISKVPDIYDSAKYDSIHNRQLNISIEELYYISRKLANIVVPNEYGITPETKLRIGVGICSCLLGKLLVDLDNTREESIITAALCKDHKEWSKNSLEMRYESEFGDFGSLDDFYICPNRFNNMYSSSSENSNTGNKEENGNEDEQEVGHRLCPTYAMNINSPFRHVRTRMYFTSESHIHALINVLRYCHIMHDCQEPLVCKEGENLLSRISEYDYLTHIVFRMFENMKVSVDDPERFRVEIEFSPGAAFEPFQQTKIGGIEDHVMPLRSRVSLHSANGICLTNLECLLKPYAILCKIAPQLGWITFQQLPSRKPAVSPII